MINNQVDERIEHVCNQLFSEQNKEMILAFLNALLYPDKEPQIIKVERMATNKMVWQAKTTNRELLKIQFQVRTTKFYHERSLYYRTELQQQEIAEQARGYVEERNVQIYVVTYHLLQESTNFHNIYRLFQDKEKLSKLELHYLELPKLPKRPLTKLEDWLWFIMYLAKPNKSKQYQNLVNGNEHMQQAERIINESYRVGLDNNEK